MALPIPINAAHARLDRYKLNDKLGTVSTKDFHQCDTHEKPLVNIWRDQAVQDIKQNIVEGRYFGAGRAFGPVVFTRDIALSGVLALNRHYPELMRQSLHFDRKTRYEAGWKVIRDSSALDIKCFPAEPTLFDFDEFIANYRTADFTRRTDDVVWLWAAADLIRRNDDRDEWAWLYENGLRGYDDFYSKLYDPQTGLYRGQACFVDVMMCGYPHRNDPADPRDHHNFLIHHVDDIETPEIWEPGFAPASLADSLLLRASSTNALHVLGMNAIAEAAGKLGLSAEAQNWNKRADALRNAIHTHLLRPDGAPAFALEASGHLNERLHPLSTAFCQFAGILPKERVADIFDLHPVLPAGIPLFTPFYEENPHCYHNHSCWPFADAFFCRAAWEATGKRTWLERWLLFNGRACRNNQGFRELTDARTAKPLGSSHQLWSAAGFLGCLDAWDE